MRAVQEELTNTSRPRKQHMLYIGGGKCKHLHPQACAGSQTHTCAQTSITLLGYRGNPVLSVTCYSRWNSAYTGVEGKKICFLFSRLQTKILFSFTRPSLLWVCFCTSLARCALLLLVPRVCDHVSLADSPDCSSPEPTPDPRSLSSEAPFVSPLEPNYNLRDVIWSFHANFAKTD